MEFASKLRWGIVILIGILVIILIGWGMASIARSVFDGFDSGSDTAEVVSDPFAVETASTVKLIVDGPVVANDEHKSYEIEISQGVVSMKVFNAYNQILVNERSYPNTPDAFEAFLSALARLNVTARQPGTTIEDDYNEIGACATGKRYIIEIDENLRRWSTSCSSRQGTAAVSMSQVRSLFRKQVPDFGDLVRGTGL